MSRPTIGALTPVLLPRKGMSGRIIPKPIRSIRTTRKRINKADFREAVVLAIDFLLPFKCMFKNKLYSIFLLSLMGSFLVAQRAQAERVYGQIEPPRFKVGRLALKYEMDRFKARSNFSKNGGSSNLLGSFEATNVFLGAENDLSLKWSFSAGLLMGASRSSIAGDQRRSTNIKGLQFGLSRALSFAKDKFNIIGDLKFFLSLYENSYGSDEVSLGDGSSWIQAGSWVGTDAFKYFRLWLYGGIQWPLRGLSKNLVFLARPEFKLWGGRLGVGIEGQIPLIKDKATDDPTNRLRLIDEYNGGSFYYQAVNSEYMAASAWFGFEPAALTELKIGFAEVISGRSAPKGFRAFVALEVSFSVTRTSYEFPYIKVGRKESKLQRNSGVRRLKNYAKPKKRSKERLEP